MKSGKVLIEKKRKYSDSPLNRAKPTRSSDRTRQENNLPMACRGSENVRKYIQWRISIKDAESRYLGMI